MRAVTGAAEPGSAGVDGNGRAALLLAGDPSRVRSGASGREGDGSRGGAAAEACRLLPGDGEAVGNETSRCGASGGAPADGAGTEQLPGRSGMAVVEGRDRG